MKKLILSSVMAFALLASMPLAAQNTEKTTSDKAKTECPKEKKADNKKSEAKPACCSKDKKEAEAKE